MHSHPEGHSHDHEGSHSHVPKDKRSLWWVLALTGTYLVAEIIGGIVSGSLALLADAGHMALDVAAVALGLFASWIAARPPTLTKTYGYYRAEILAALLNGITLVVVSLWIFYEAYERFGQPPEVKGGIMAVVAAGGLVVNLIGMFVMHSSKNDGLNMQGVWLHLLTDALGSVAALLGGFFIWMYNWNLADPIISVVIGVLILFGAWKLLVDCVDVLLVSVPKGIDAGRIKEDIEGLADVDELHDLHIWAVGNGVYALSAHIRMKKELDSGETLKLVARLLKDRYRIDHTTLQLEPPSFVHEGAHFCAPGRSFHSHA